MLRSFNALLVALLLGAGWLGASTTLLLAQGNQPVRNPQTQPQRNGQVPPQGTLQNQQGRPLAQAQRQPTPPPGFDISPDQQKWIDDILGYWQVSSSKVSTYSTSFTRWEYNPAFVRDPNTPWTEAVGVIRYAQPDKAMYRVDEMKYYEAPKRVGDRATYVKREGEIGEHWVCTGDEIMELDSRNKQVRKHTIPQEMRGAAISNGPLPFLFGAEAARLKQRYWFRPLPPPKDKDGRFIEGEYWLAAKPKYRDDAANYELVEIIIDQKEFLPKAMQIYLPGGKERKVFEFGDRTKNPKLALIMPHFIKPQVPRGWKVIDEQVASPAPSGALAPTQRNESAVRQIPVSNRR